MPRYYFNSQDGEPVSDTEGLDLPDDDAARREALALLGEILRYDGRAFWDTGRFNVVVIKENGRTVVSLSAHREATRAN